MVILIKNTTIYGNHAKIYVLIWESHRDPRAAIPALQWLARPCCPIPYLDWFQHPRRA